MHGELDSKLIRPSVQIHRLAHSATGDSDASRCTGRCLVQDHERVVALTAILSQDYESLQIIQLGFTALRDQAPCLGCGVLPWKVGPALNGALRVPQSGGGFSGAGAGFATIRFHLSHAVVHPVFGRGFTLQHRRGVEDGST
jgi:hypothetical protein